MRIGARAARVRYAAAAIAKRCAAIMLEAMRLHILCVNVGRARPCVRHANINGDGQADLTTHGAAARKLLALKG
jgi:hypothetical protein